MAKKIDCIISVSQALQNMLLYFEYEAAAENEPAERWRLECREIVEYTRAMKQVAPEIERLIQPILANGQ